MAIARRTSQQCAGNNRCWKCAAIIYPVVMTNVFISSDIRQLVNETFAELHLSGGAEPRETILIRGGHYCGRRFDVENGHAVWFMEEEQIKFFRADGRLARVIEPVAAPAITRQAA